VENHPPRLRSTPDEQPTLTEDELVDTRYARVQCRALLGSKWGLQRKFQVGFLFKPICLEHDLAFMASHICIFYPSLLMIYTSSNCSDNCSECDMFCFQISIGLRHFIDDGSENGGKHLLLAG